MDLTKKYTIATDISADDYIMIIQDGCIKIISYEDFIKEVSLGGFSICEAWLNCVDGIGTFDNITAPDADTPPTMQDLFVSMQNRQQDRMFAQNEFLTKYYDAEGDAFGKIIIVGGDVSNFKLNGVPVSVGMVIDIADIPQLEYDAKDQDAAYIQELFFEAYDINNVKATSI